VLSMYRSPRRWAGGLPSRSSVSLSPAACPALVPRGTSASPCRMTPSGPTVPRSESLQHYYCNTIGTWSTLSRWIGHVCVIRTS